MNINNYEEFISYLKTFEDLKYKKFHQKLLNDTTYKLIGIRVPILRKIAKQFKNNDNIIKLLKHIYYEEVIIHGLIIGYSKYTIEETFDLLDIFLKYNTNWAINDTVASNLKIFKKEKEKGIKKIKEYLKSSNPFTIRFGLVLLLDYYLNDDYIDEILKLVLDITNDEYYVKMAISWLISYCYIKYPKKILKIIENKKLDKWIHNKAISKIHDSYQVSNEDKVYLNTLRY